MSIYMQIKQKDKDKFMKKFIFKNKYIPLGILFIFLYYVSSLVEIPTASLIKICKHIPCTATVKIPDGSHFSIILLTDTNTSFQGNIFIRKEHHTIEPSEQPKESI